MIGRVSMWEIRWTGGLPHRSWLPHLHGVPHLHVNRHLVLPLDMQMKQLVMETCDEAFFFFFQQKGRRTACSQATCYGRTGCSFLSIGDWRILRLQHWILRLSFGILWLLCIQTWSLFQNTLLWRYTFLLPPEFLIKTLVEWISTRQAMLRREDSNFSLEYQRNVSIQSVPRVQIVETAQLDVVRIIAYV